MFISTFYLSTQSDNCGSDEFPRQATDDAVTLCIFA